MRRVLFAVALALMLAPAADLVFGKAHVPTHKIQMCHEGRVIAVGGPSMGGHLGHGDAQVPACDFNNVFFTGDSCQVVDGQVVLGSPRDDAGGLAPACPPGAF